MTTRMRAALRAFTLVVLGLAIAAMGIYVAEVDDAPGGAAMGMALMVVAVVLAVRAARDRLPLWASRTAIAVGVVIAALAAFLAHGVAATAPLFPASQEVPSVAGQEPADRYAAAVSRARELVRAAVSDQNLPGVSVAVGIDNAIVWAEGFGWRDAASRTPVTPATRFNIGTAARVIAPAVGPLGLTSTGAEPATEWSPERIGEPEEDFPLFTLIRDVAFRPVGLAQAQPLPGDRATFYVPSDVEKPRRGRRLMRMRDLACCADGMAFYSTPSDVVRVALATNPGTVEGALAGGTVISLVTGPDGIAVAVTSNLAHADTASVARGVRDTFAGQAP